MMEMGFLITIPTPGVAYILVEMSLAVVNRFPEVKRVLVVTRHLVTMSYQIMKASSLLMTFMMMMMKFLVRIPGVTRLKRPGVINPSSKSGTSFNDDPYSGIKKPHCDDGKDEQFISDALTRDTSGSS